MNTYLFYAVMQLLMVNEGFESEAYQVRGVWHIGFGYNLEARMPNPPCPDYSCLLWSKEEAFEQLERDARHANDRLNIRYACYKTLPNKAKIVLIDMSINMGVSGLMKFTELLVSLCVKNYKTAGENILDSDYADDVPSRARRNVHILREGYEI